MIIGFCGKKRSGKDTGASILINKYGFIRYAFADALKNACSEIFLLSEEQVNGNKKEEIDERWNLSPRKIFQIFGTEIFREKLDNFFPELKEYKNNFWINRFKLWYNNETKKNPNVKIVITDIRFPNEAEIVKELGGNIIKVQRNNNNKNNNDKHSSESLIDTIKGDFNIINDRDIKTYHVEIDNIYNNLINS